MNRAARSGSRAQMSADLTMARSARLVATGCVRTNSRLPVTMQQKYWDHGRSTALLTTTCPIPFARSSCACGGKAIKASNLPLGQEPHGRGRGMRHPGDVLLGIQSHIGAHTGDEDVIGGSQLDHGDRL